MSPTNEAKTHDSVKEGAARQIDRICALPEPQRQAEIRKLESESGLELQCAEAPKTP
jgi:hypothetical protein